MSDFNFIATEGDSGSANPIQGELRQQSGSVETGFNLTSYTGTFSMRQVHYEGALTSDPTDTGGATGSTLIDAKAATGQALFIADEHNSRKLIFTSGRALGKTMTITDTTASGTLTVSTAAFATLQAREKDRFVVYSTKVDASQASITNATEGQFQYNWGSTDLNTVGAFIGEFKFSHTSTANRVLHFPVGEGARRKIRITISPAIDV